MAIKSLKLDKETFDAMGIGLATLPLGQHPLNMPNLGKIVVLAGPNGAGKTRFLNLLSTLTPKVSSTEGKEGIRKTLDHWRMQSDQAQADILALQSLLDKGESSNLNSIRQLEEARHTHTSALSACEQNQMQLRAAESVTLSGTDRYLPIHFVPSNAKLSDAASILDTEAKDLADGLLYGGSADAHLKAPAHARAVLRSAVVNYYRRMHESPASLEPSKQELERDKLIELVRILLGLDAAVDLTDDQDLVINGERNYWQILSPGEQVLFQFACLLHAQGHQLGDSIILMDEPENHLHPAVLNEVVDRLTSLLQGGQIWIATHSVPLIAHLLSKDSDCLWYAKDGAFNRAGLTPSVVLEGLLGGPDGAEALRTLTMLPAMFAIAKFMADCLVPPGVAGPDIEDPQTKQIAEIVTKKWLDESRQIRLLDFGAGVGRTLTTLAATSTDASGWLDYFAFEPDATKHAALGREILTVYPDSVPSERTVDSLHKLGTLDAGSVDVAVMCNVLHEIDPSEWLKSFGPGSPLEIAMSQSGHLLVVEDYGIRVGERAHAYGFLLLDEPELRILFAITESDCRAGRFLRVDSTSPRRQGRLVAHLIGKECLKRVSAATQSQAIKKLHDRMRDVVKDHMRNPSNLSATSGRDYARSAQLYASAAIWLTDHPVSA